MARVFCVQDGTGKKLSFDGACPSGWKPLASAAAPTPAGGTTTPSTTTSNSRVIVPSYTAIPNQGPGQQWYSSPQRTYLSYDNQATAEEGYASLSMSEKAYIDAVAKHDDYRRTGSSLYAQAVRAITDDSYSGPTLSPFQWVQNYGRGIGFTNADGTIAGDGPGGGSRRSGGGSGAAAPVAAGPDAMKRMMDQLSMDMLGRTLSDKEFNRYYGKYTGAFGKNPAMDPQQHGTEALQRNDDYQEFQVASKFAKAMQSVIEGAA